MLPPLLLIFKLPIRFFLFDSFASGMVAFGVLIDVVRSGDGCDSCQACVDELFVASFAAFVGIGFGVVGV